MNGYGLTTFGGECTGYVPKAPALCDANCCVPNPMNLPALRCTGKCWNMPIVPFYWERLAGDPAFRNDTKCR